MSDGRGLMRRRLGLIGRLVLLGACFDLLATEPLRAITVGPFGPHGEGGLRNGQLFRIGAGGVVQELDSFLQIGALDLNGSQPGTTAQLSANSLPAGLAFGFSASLSNNAADLILTYSFTNNSAAAFPDMRFFVFLDPEIDETINTFFNEYGIVSGTIGSGSADSAPDQWQLGEPGFSGGTLFRNLGLAALSNSNSVPQNVPDDVAMALGFSLGTLEPGAWTIVQVMISETTDQIGSFVLTQHDSDPASTTTVTFSGQARVNIPPFGNVSNLVQLTFNWQPCGARDLLGTLSISNLGSVALSGPFQLGMNETVQRFFPKPTATLPDGLPYVDLSNAVAAALPGGVLPAGQSVVLPSAVDVYSRNRAVPPVDTFELWAAQR